MAETVPKASESAHGRIRVLDPELANQIAAGEVVERPASVVKELVDNAIDAGATRVEVRLIGGGSTEICVLDNGHGIHPDDLPLTVRAHATSKLDRAEQLADIETLGFRGEALASLAAVSQLSIRSRRESATIGTELFTAPGRAPEIRTVGMPLGTIVRAKNLFANVPARRKFLRSEATEIGHCSEALCRVALVHPQVHLILHHGDRQLANFSATDETGRVEQVLSRRAAGPYRSVSGEVEGMRVHGWLATPENAGRQRSSTYFIVRRRVISERNFAKICREAYGEKLERERHPAVVLFVDPPPGKVDVNAHPRKSEVRFAEPQVVYTGLRKVMSEIEWSSSTPETRPTDTRDRRAEDYRTSLRSSVDVGVTRVEDADCASATKTGTGRGTSNPAGPGGVGPKSAAYRLGTRASLANYDHHKSEIRAKVERIQASKQLADTSREGVLELPLGTSEASSEAASPTATQPADRAPAVPQPRPAPPRDSRPAAAPDPRFAAPEHEYLSTLPGQLALFRFRDELVAVDVVKLRAHLIEKELAAELGTRAELGAQALLEPVLIRRSAADVALCTTRADLLEKLGFVVEAFGATELRIRAVPAGISRRLESANIGDLVDRILPWLRLQDTGSARSEHANGADPRRLIGSIAAAQGRDPTPRLARRWFAQVAHEADLFKIPGVQRWTHAQLRREEASS